jgi:transposase
MRATTAFKRLLRLPGASMVDVAFGREGVIVTVKLRRRRRIVERVVAEHLDEERLHGLVAIGVDEISWRRHQRYLTSVVDHSSGAIVWCSPGRNSETLAAFFALLGERRCSIHAVSIDMSGGYEKAIRECIPQAQVAFDPFHVVRLAQRAVDQVRRDEWNAHERSHTPTVRRAV